MKETYVGLKLGSIALLIAGVLAYSLYVKKDIESVLAENGDLVLKNLPDFNVPYISKETKYSKENLLKQDGSLYFVHFWATWCGPCEAELPSFINLVKKWESRGVKALLVAVQDEDKKIKKYLKRYGELPESFTIVHDITGKMMSRFGTVKLPETYLFSKEGKNLNKYVGPQDWDLSRYDTRLGFYLTL